MKNSNLELFKQALNEGLSNRIDRTINECTVKIKPSKQHTLVMRTILYGKGYHSKPLSPKMRKVIAILVAAAMLLTSCAIIYRDEIRGFIEEMTEHFTKLSHSGEAKGAKTIEEIYEFTYVPNGYVVEKIIADPLSNRFIYMNSDGYNLSLNQSVLDSARFFVDTEDYRTILIVNTYEVYYKTSKGNHFYILNDGKYAITITSDTILSNEEIISIINGIKVK